LVRRETHRLAIIVLLVAGEPFLGSDILIGCCGSDGLWSEQHHCGCGILKRATFVERHLAVFTSAAHELHLRKKSQVRVASDEPLLPEPTSVLLPALHEYSDHGADAAGNRSYERAGACDEKSGSHWQSVSPA
jgi:hypothetical protein